MIQAYEPEVRALLERVEQDPRDEKALNDLWQALVARERYADLAHVVELAAHRRRDPVGAADLHFRAAELARTYLKDEDRALRGYERAAALDPRLVRACAAARHILVKQRRYARVAPLLPLELAEAAGSATERAKILGELASAHGETVDLSNKVALLHQLSVRFPKDVEVQRALARCYRVRADKPGGTEQDKRHAARIYARLAAQSRGDDRRAFAEQALDAWPGEEAAYTILEQALTAARETEGLDEKKRAFIEANGKSELAQRMRKDLAEELRAAGNLHDAIAMLRPLVSIDPYVGRTLVEMYRESGRLVDLDKLLAEVNAEAPLDRVALLRERAEIARTRGEQPKRIGFLTELLSMDPTDEAALAVVAEDAILRGAFNELRELYASAARAAEAPSSAHAKFVREVARLSEEKLGDFDGAIDAWLELAATDDLKAEARGKLEGLYERARRYSELAQHLEASAAALPADDPEARRLAVRAVDVRRDRLNDLAGAQAGLEALLEKFPGDEALEDALVDAKLWRGDPSDSQALEETLRARAHDAPPARAAARFTQLARFIEKDEARRDEAISLWTKVRTLDPTQSAAWGAEALLLEKEGRREALLETLLAHAKEPVAATEQARIPLLVRAARLAMELGDSEKATAAAEQASEWAPGNDEVSKLLMEVYAAAEAGPKSTKPVAVDVPAEKPAVDEIAIPTSFANADIAPPPVVSEDVAKQLESEHPPAPTPPPVVDVEPEKKDVAEPPMIVLPKP